ncbi:MAG TPA: two-component regulator propeller domain-containing protein, partial [Candidatus Rifleibacterium sp.]|nr:two-component regulator propeller domain-containing protein [Candidatus Rifleibacterium sp.]
MYQKFFDFQDACQKAIADNPAEKLISPLLKGLWVGTQDSGLVIFATNGQRHQLTAENSKLPSDDVTAIACAPDGETWVGTANAGLMRYSSRAIGGKGKVNTLLACRPTRVRVLSDMLMIGTENDGLYIYDIKSLQQAGHYAFNGFHRRVSDFALDRDGNLWVTGDAGVLIWNGSSW